MPELTVNDAVALSATINTLAHILIVATLVALLRWVRGNGPRPPR